MGVPPLVPLMDTLKYACFVSYQKGDLMETFVKGLTEALETYLAPYTGRMGVYWDTELKPGILFQQRLAETLCQSVCMVVVHTPQYWKRDFCLREFAAMEDLERQRRQLCGARLAGRGMIIPVILRDRKGVPPELLENRHFADFTAYSLAVHSMKEHPAYIPDIQTIVEHIYDLCCSLEHVTVPAADLADCQQYRLPSAPPASPPRAPRPIP